MEIRFASRRLYEASISPEAARRILGQLAERYLGRLDTILAAATFEDLKQMRSLRLHPLKGDRAGQWGVDLNANFRLVISIEGETVIVESVEDYHGD